MNAVGRSDGPVVAILSFHKIGEPPPGWRSWFYVPEETFAGFLHQLREAGWAVIDVPTFLRALVQPDSVPPRVAMITFDDGYRSMREAALPWLKRFAYPAVLFVPTEYIGGRNTFDAGVEPDEAICDWDDLLALEAADVSVQSHAASHRRLSDLTPTEQEDELRRSKVALEAGLGTAVRLIAFPYGDPPNDTTALAAAGYQAAFLYGGGPVRLPVTDAGTYRLERLAMGPDTDLAAELGNVP